MATILFVVLGYKAKITTPPPPLKKCINEINVKRYLMLIYIHNKYLLGIFT